MFTSKIIAPIEIGSFEWRQWLEQSIQRWIPERALETIKALQCVPPMLLVTIAIPLVFLVGPLYLLARLPMRRFHWGSSAWSDFSGVMHSNAKSSLADRQSL